MFKLNLLEGNTMGQKKIKIIGKSYKILLHLVKTYIIVAIVVSILIFFHILNFGEWDSLVAYSLLLFFILLGLCKLIFDKKIEGFLNNCDLDTYIELYTLLYREKAITKNFFLLKKSLVEYYRGDFQQSLDTLKMIHDRKNEIVIFREYLKGVNNVFLLHQHEVEDTIKNIESITLDNKRQVKQKEVALSKLILFKNVIVYKKDGSEILKAIHEDTQIAFIEKQYLLGISLLNNNEILKAQEVLNTIKDYNKSLFFVRNSYKILDEIKKSEKND